MKSNRRSISFALGMVLVSAPMAHGQSFTLQDALSFPFIPELTAAPNTDRIAWVRVVKGVRNVWVADGPKFEPRQVTQFTADDGQELSQLTFSSDGGMLVFVRGGDHDANWPVKGDLAPNPTSSPVEPKVMLWSADPHRNHGGSSTCGGRRARSVGEGGTCLRQQSPGVDSQA